MRMRTIIALLACALAAPAAAQTAPTGFEQQIQRIYEQIERSSAVVKDQRKRHIAKRKIELTLQAREKQLGTAVYLAANKALMMALRGKCALSLPDDHLSALALGYIETPQDPQVAQGIVRLQAQCAQNNTAWSAAEPLLKNIGDYALKAKTAATNADAFLVSSERVERDLRESERPEPKCLFQ